MDFDAIKENISVILLIAGLIIAQFFMGRRRKSETTNQAIVESLLHEIRFNEALLEGYHQRQKPRKFEVTAWKRNNKLDFLGQSLQGSLSEAYMIIEDFNQQIGAAKKYKSAGYMASVDVDKLKKPLAKSEQGLKEWLLADTAANPPKRPGMFDVWLGRS
ncbi:hypothetical protein ACFLXK_02230 [Chloroflexota bacterium]